LKTDKSFTKEKKLSIKSRTENLQQIREFVNSAAVEAGMMQESIGEMMLAVDEACTNIIKHAYKSFPDGEIIITVKHSQNKFTIKIVDYGNSFEPDVVPKPDLNEYYRQRRVGGLGLYLIKSLMDEVTYVSKPGKYNEVLLSKNLNSTH
jgi:serine/threonine-protein kinase RsbW